MNGAESIVQTLVAGGVELCFANPGTSEIHIVAALSRMKEIRAVPCLFEGVAVGAADGYARMTGRPACTLLHLGPGFANGIANLHNAKRARVPMLNLIGDHATYHLKYDAPLTSDIAAIARPYSVWFKSASSTEEAGAECAEAIAASRKGESGIATFVVPGDVAWSEGGKIASVPQPEASPMPSASAIDTAVTMLRKGKRTALLLGGHTAQGDALQTAGRIAAATGARLLAPFGFARIERGAGRPIVTRIAYVMEQAMEQLRDVEQLILVNAAVPVAFFAYPGQPSVLIPEGCTVHALAGPDENGARALEALANRLGAATTPFAPQDLLRPEWPRGAFTATGLAEAVGAVLPEHAIVVDESLTAGRALMSGTRGAPPHDWLVNTGGSIGLGTPMAVGAAIACPDRPVLCFSGDGSFMYTLQSLWTAAREQLQTTFVVFANRAYNILKGELAKLDGQFDARALDLLDLSRPDLDFVQLARGLGVPARRVTSLEDFTLALEAGLSSKSPNLIEVAL